MINVGFCMTTNSEEKKGIIVEPSPANFCYVIRVEDLNQDVINGTNTTEK